MNASQQDPTAYEEESIGSDVVAVVVTYRRPDLVRETLEAIANQTQPPRSVILVDNDGDEQLESLVKEGAVGIDIDYVSTEENVGWSGGLAIGMTRALEAHGAEWLWLLDDDSPPSNEALRTASQAARSTTNVGAVSQRGGFVRRGRIRHDLRAGQVDELTPADFLLVDGALVSRTAVERAGLPREDFFIMLEDVEYTVRIRDAGFDLYVRPADGSAHLYQGSGRPWRGYYQSRNHLRIAIERRSPTWLWGWVVREAGINAHHLVARRWSSIAFRGRGALDGLSNRMGKRVDPSAT
ncbi:MAG: glycosyltransferase [Actinomycetota bacterium]